MRIGNTDRPNWVHLHDITSGDAFLYCEKLYIKVDMTYVNYIRVPDVTDPVFATQLFDGTLVCFDASKEHADNGGFVELFDAIVVSHDKLAEHLSFPEAYEKVTGEEVPW